MIHKHRRDFLKTSTLAIAGSIFSIPSFGSSFLEKKNWTVGEIMDLFISQVPDAPFPNTVDTLKSGNKDTVVTGIVTTMFATITVIREAIAKNANFIIAHEPTFYNHLDETEWLVDDDVFEYKKKLLDEHRIAVWRNHDYVHSLQVDGVQKGVVDQIGWTEYYKNDAVLNIPNTTLAKLITHLKIKLDVPSMRYVGDLNQSISKVLLYPGAIGGRRQIEGLMLERPDVLIVGESPEWETPEYVRNANEKGDKVSLVVIGHSASEEGGSEFMAEWVKKFIPEMPVYHIPSENSLKIF